MKQITDNHDAYTRCLLDIFRRVYAELGVDFDMHGKHENWFMEYEMPLEQQESLAKDVMRKYRVSGWRAKSVMSSYHLGPSPKFTKQDEIKLRREHKN